LCQVTLLALFDVKVAIDTVDQGFPTRGPRAKSGLPSFWKWPATSEHRKI